MRKMNAKPLLDILSERQVAEIFLHLQSDEEKKRLNEAFAVLQISRRQFAKLHTKQLKREFLIYNLCLFEFKHYRQPTQLMALGQKAFDVICKSSLIQDHVDEYGPNSQGLVELDLPRMLNEKKDEGAFKLSRSSLKVSAPKTDGVEPGYLGHQIEDAFLAFFQKFPDPSDRLEQIKLMSGNLDFFLEGYKIGLARHVVKLTYENISKSGEVVPDKKDLARTSTMKMIQERFGWFSHAVALQLYQKSKTCNLVELNCDAVSEVVANDVARAFGMVVQNQCLVKNKHANGRLRLPLKAEWVEGASLLQPLAGSTDNQNYHVEPVQEGSGVQYVSSKKIRNLSEYFALFACLGDRDKVGSRGQNLLLKLDTLIGIDFGHAYSNKNSLVKTLRSDFTFRGREFKNYSIFLDAPRSELMKGVIKLARWKGEALDPSIVDSYGSEFSVSLQAIPPQADERIFDDYIKKFTALKAEDQANADEYAAIIRDIERKKALHIAARDAIIAKFKPFLSLPAQWIDMLENFEKLWAASLGNTSMRSPDSTVMLEHLRVIKNPVIDWKIEARNSQDVSIVAEFNSQQGVAQAVATLEKHGVSGGLQFSERGNTLVLRFPRHQLAHVANLVCEDNIKACYHPKDHRVATQLKKEKAFVGRLGILKKHGLEVETKGKRGRDLELLIHAKEEANPAKRDWVATHTQEIANFVAKGLSTCQCSIEMQMGGRISAQVPRDKMDRVERFLTVFDACYQHYEKARDQLAALSQEIQKQEGLEIDLVLKLIYHEGEFKFHLMVRSEDGKEEVNLDLVTEGDILQTIAQLETIKSDVLQTYQQYKYQKRIVLLAQQVDSLSAFLEKKYPGDNRSPQIFAPLDPAVQLRRYLKQWSYAENAFSNAVLKELGETVKSRLHYIKKDSAFDAYLDEKGLLDDVVNSIEILQRTPEVRCPVEPKQAEASPKEPYQEMSIVQDTRLTVAAMA